MNPLFSTHQVRPVSRYCQRNRLSRGKNLQVVLSATDKHSSDTRTTTSFKCVKVPGKAFVKVCIHRVNFFLVSKVYNVLSFSSVLLWHDLTFCAVFQGWTFFRVTFSSILTCLVLRSTTVSDYGQYSVFQRLSIDMVYASAPCIAHYGEFLSLCHTHTTDQLNANNHTQYSDPFGATIFVSFSNVACLRSMCFCGWLYFV